MSVIDATPLLAAAGGDYQISRSVRLRSSASAYFNRTPASAGNRKTWTWSGWHKRGALQDTWLLGADDGSLYSQIQFLGDYLRFGHVPNTGGTVYGWRTQAVFRDPSAWYHIVFAIDTTQATAANRIRIYVNGVEQTSLVDATGYGAIPQNTDTFINAALSHMVGRFIRGANNQMDGYLTEVNFIDGQALTPSSFGETDSITGVWKPKKYAGTYGTNGFYLNFSDNSSNTATTIGKDNSGNGNNWTPNNISVTAGATYDSMLDVPTLYADGGNGRGNYAVLNRLNSVATLTAGNLNYSSPSTAPAPVYSSIGMTSGKWYFEYTLTATNMFVGVWGNGNAGMLATGYPSYYWDIGASSAIALNMEKSSGTASGTLGNLAANDVYGIALDMDNTTVYFYKNNSLVQTITGMTFVGPLFFVIGSWSGANASSGVSNFGQRPFAYTPPTGFKALNTQNLPEPTIKKGNQYFDVSLYTGNGGTLAVTNSGSMQPDLVWVKSRSAATSNDLFDSVRGATLGLTSNGTSAEGTWSGVTAFNSNGFTLGSNTSDNASGATYVAWQWKESPSAGFDIVTYTGTGGVQTVNHSLGVAPKMILVKSRSDGSGIAHWTVYHAGMDSVTPQSYAMHLNLTNARNASSIYWNSTAPTSTTFTLGGGSAGLDINNSGQTFIAYLFSEVAGFSRFGSYTGNGSADGPFVFCGFRPRYVMIKRTDAVADWQIMDTARSANNVEQQVLYANTSAAEANYSGTDGVDGLSNGFKIRVASSGNVNASGATYIYAAFAESPFKNSLAR